MGINCIMLLVLGIIVFPILSSSFSHSNHTREFKILFFLCQLLCVLEGRRINCILAPPDICLSSETIKYVLIVMRGFSRLFLFLSFCFFVALLVDMHKESRFTWKRNFSQKIKKKVFKMRMSNVKRAQNRKNESNYNIFGSYSSSLFYVLFMWLFSSSFKILERNFFLFLFWMRHKEGCNPSQIKNLKSADLIRLKMCFGCAIECIGFFSGKKGWNTSRSKLSRKYFIKFVEFQFW